MFTFIWKEQHVLVHFKPLKHIYINNVFNELDID